MMRRTSLLLAILIVVAGCDGGGITGPVTTNTAAARKAWVNAAVKDYSFEFSMLTEWGPQSGYYQVVVRNGAVVEARDPSGTLLADFTETVDQQWARILSAQNDGALKIGVFTAQGVPVEWLADRDGWADDAVHVWVRNFQKL